MDFDHEKYSQLMNELIMDSSKVREFRSEALRKALIPICEFLRIGKITAEVRNSSGDIWKVAEEPYDYYDSGIADEKRCCSTNERVSRNGTATYTICQKSGEPDWTSEEFNRIRVLEKHIFLISERAYTIEIVREMPMHDTELEVYSLPYFFSTTQSLINQGRIGEFGAAYFNLRGFSAINRTLGRNAANGVMRSFITGLVEKLNYDECVCRIGGDIFVALFKEKNQDMVRDYLLNTSVKVKETGESVTVSACAGYYIIPDSTETALEVMDRISTAYQLAKNVMKRSYVFYDDIIMKQQDHIQEIESIFPDAIDKEEFKVFYQPKTHLNNYQMAGAEALCRWFRDGRIIPPGEFIPVLENSRAICTLDFYMLDHVCRDIRRWLDEKREVVKVSVNLSRLHMGDDDLLETILGIIDRHNVPHQYIEIELTETTTDVDFTELKKIVNGLREQNISTSVDDFGMGYSSLNLIRELPWNVLKIDKSFLPTQLENQDHTKVKMLQHIITMSQDLGLECIVEGVETAEQVKLLKDCKCYLAQGFYFDKPLPVKEFERRLDDISAG